MNISLLELTGGVADHDILGSGNRSYYYGFTQSCPRATKAWLGSSVWLQQLVPVSHAHTSSGKVVAVSAAISFPPEIFWPL